MDRADSSIELPALWHDLTATSTRFAIMYELYALAHWSEDRFADRKGRHLGSICDIFFDDYMFYDNPESMIGQSLYRDELEIVKVFGAKLNEFLECYDKEHGIKNNLDRTFTNKEFQVPKEISEAAQYLLSSMKTRGDPKVETYFLNAALS